VINLQIVEGNMISRTEIFDDTDLDAALARFDELNHQVSQLENVATRAWTRIADAYNRRDLNGFLALQDGRFEDRRNGLRNEGPMDAKFAHAALFEAPASWQMETEPVAIRGYHLALTRVKLRDFDEVDRPITVETLIVTAVNDHELVSRAVNFDADDISGALRELTARWIASGEVSHPQVIEAYLKILQELNRHDWDAYSASLADATYLNHRQLGTGETVADFTASVAAIASLIPNVCVVPTEILNCSASGVLGDVVAKGTSRDGGDVEIPMMMLGLFNGDRLTHFEMFDPDQRALALARFQELNQS
jgi:hypothetical protein